jgi:hypothetical protein
MPIYQSTELASSAFDVTSISQHEISDQPIAPNTGLAIVDLKLLSHQEGLHVPLHNVSLLRYQEGSDNESQYSSTGTSSPADQRSLSGAESPYEGSLNSQCVPDLHSSFTQASSEPPNSHLLNIPTELHLLIFSHLDPIDGTCLGLTNAHFYNLHKVLNGTVTLSTRRKGRAWEFLTKQECRFCAVHRCQLHMHLRDWMPAKYEYCAIKQVYGLKAQEGTKKYCYRSNPLKPGKCGRHPVNEEAS